MKKRLFFYLTILFILLAFGFLMVEIDKSKQENENLLFTLNTNTLKPNKLILDVPYINEAPDGNFSGNWKNACEEASITMVEKYYSGEKSVSIEEAKISMRILFDIQDRLYGTNASIDAIKIVEVINKYSSYKAILKNSPTINEIKKELIYKHPIISLHYGFDLQNKNIPFSVIGSYYHVMVIVGYDNKTKEFIVNDDGDMKNGKNHRYEYNLFMNSLHDYNFALNKTNGPARVIFTNSNKN
jgi:hypothetical protein